jgi:hypothetical protein
MAHFDSEALTQGGGLVKDLRLWTCDDGTIRVNKAGQPSVFDMIKSLGGKKNPWDCWRRLIETHPEVVAKCEDFKFPGAGQRETPVAKDKEAVFYILTLLPGQVGRKYREQSAKLFTRWLEDPAGLVGDLAGQLNEDEKKRLEARLNGKRTRNTFTDALKEHGVQQHGYAHCTNAIYEPVLGASARGLRGRIAERERVAIAKVKNPRDHMTITELGDVEFAERVAEGQLRRHDIHGNYGCERVCRASSEHTRKLLNGEIDIPGILN